jgi:hypothetical protein
VIGKMTSLQTQMERLKAAIATASSGFQGTPGTEFETPSTDAPNNLFGVVRDNDAPGIQGTNYSYAMGQLAASWDTFWATAEPYIKQLDNGQATM